MLVSYPIHRLAAGENPCRISTAKGFWGLDRNPDAPQSGFSAAHDTLNLLWEGQGLVQRPGYTAVAALPAAINGIYSVGSSLLVHAGTKLWRIKNGEVTLVEGELANHPSFGVVRRQRVTARRCVNLAARRWVREVREQDFLFLCDGNRYQIYDGSVLREVQDPYWGDSLTALAEEGIYPEFLATVPFVSVGNDAEGGDIDPRGGNRLSRFYCESFWVEGETSALRLRAGAGRIDENTPPEVRLRDDKGVWRGVALEGIEFMRDEDRRLGRIKLPTLQAGISFTVDAEGYVTETGKGSYRMAADGSDNLQVIYAVRRDKPITFNRGTAMGLYGPEGRDTVLFLGGAGMDYHSEPNDFLCFRDTSVEQLGRADAKVRGYCLLQDGRLAVLKERNDNATVYYRCHRTAAVGTTRSGAPFTVDVYPSEVGGNAVGCVAARTVSMAGNEPCFLGDDGLYTVQSVSNELTDLRQTLLRSADLGRLPAELAKGNPLAVRWGRYYLLINGQEAVVTDGGMKNGSYRFLRWRFAHPIRAAAVVQGVLYLGSSTGGLYRFGEGETDDGTPIEAFWETSSIEWGEDCRMRVRSLAAAVTPAVGGGFSVQLRREGASPPAEYRSASLMDFAAVDFARFSFVGDSATAWFPIQGGGLSGHSFRVRLWPGTGVCLQGVRLVYEKGGRECQ